MITDIYSSTLEQRLLVMVPVELTLSNFSDGCEALPLKPPLLSVVVISPNARLA